MIFQNQQANILRVNGAIADNFANRPASQGTYYIFYSLDTQEIFYDDVSGWILLGSGGGGTPVNIYTSDGTLLTDRFVNGNNKNLSFFSLSGFYADIDPNNKFEIFNNFFRITSQNINIGTKIGSGTEFYFGNDSFPISTFKCVLQYNNRVFGIIANSTNSFQGLRLDITNRIYQFGNLTGGNSTRLTIDDVNSTINLRSRGSFINFVNTQSLVNGITLDILYTNTNTLFETKFSNVVSGIKLDFANRVYELGQITGSNRTFLFVDDVTRQIRSSGNGINKGLTLNFNTDKYYLGDTGISGKIYLEVDNSLGFLSTYSIGGTNGILLDLISRTYSFGSIVGGNSTTLTIADSTAYPIRITGTNVTSGSSSGSSGQHLKIQINGIDYKISLENP